MSTEPQLTKTEVAEGYDQIAGRLQMSPKFYRLCFRSLNPHLKPGDTIADLGCGQGGLISEFAHGQAWRLFALDISFRLAEMTRQRVTAVRAVQGDVEHLPWKDGQFDAVLMTEVFEHLPNPQLALGEIRRALKPRGFLLLTAPNRDWFRFDEYQTKRKKYQPIDDHWYSVGEVKGHLQKAQFTVHTIRGGENLYFGGGLPRLAEKIALLVYPKLHERMKRAIFIAQRND